MGEKFVAVLLGALTGLLVMMAVIMVFSSLEPAGVDMTNGLIVRNIKKVDNNLYQISLYENEDDSIGDMFLTSEKFQIGDTLILRRK